MPAAVTRLPDAAGRFGPYGGRYVPETLTRALDQLTAEYAKARKARDEKLAKAKAEESHARSATDASVNTPADSKNANEKDASASASTGKKS